MTGFIHEDKEFEALLILASNDVGVARALVEKDYWVTHALWAIRQQGWDLWFKGGTSLSKGFGLIQRFSEDLDLRLDPGGLAIQEVRSWKSKSETAKNDRLRYFEEVDRALDLRPMQVELDRANFDRRWYGAQLRATYPTRWAAELPGAMRPYVLLELGVARVAPSVEVDMTSWVHRQVEKAGVTDEFIDNRPRAVACVHPWVTLIEKIDAIAGRFPREGVAAANFVRHYEDVAQILLALEGLPALHEGVADVWTLVALMREARDIKPLPPAHDDAFVPGDTARWQEVEAAYAAIQPMFWGPRIPLAACCCLIQDWLAGQPGA